MTRARLLRALLTRIVRPALALVLSLPAAGACSTNGDSASARPASPRPESTPQSIGSTAPGAQRRDRTVVGVFTDLRTEPLLQGADVKVSGSGTTLVLAGEVPSTAARDRALEIARRHLGTFTLVDSLRVATRVGSKGDLAVEGPTAGVPAAGSAGGESDRPAQPTNEGAP